jgi:hypothetical protein
MQYTPLPDSYFEEYSTLPVKIKPFDPKTKEIALKYLDKLIVILSESEESLAHASTLVDIEIGGSTALEMEGKGDIEINIYCTPKNWNQVNTILLSYYQTLENKHKEYRRYADISEEIQIEIIVTKGKTAYMQKNVLHYIQTHPEVWEAYRLCKHEFAYSKRVYCLKKTRFFERIQQELPEYS